MSQVQTARGPVEASALGQTLMHEHVFVLSADVQQNYPAEWGSEDERVADAVPRLTALHALGVGTIVDPTVVGLGRYIPTSSLVAGSVMGQGGRCRLLMTAPGSPGYVASLRSPATTWARPRTSASR